MDQNRRDFTMFTTLFCVLLVIGTAKSASIPTGTTNDRSTVVPNPRPNATEETGEKGDGLGLINITRVHGCRLRPADENLYDRVNQLIADGMKLIEYTIDVVNYTRNPLLEGARWTYQANKWSRASTRHGQALLALSFNYGILSLTTLTFGVHQLRVQLADEPQGCLGKLTEAEKVRVVEDILIRDFRFTHFPSIGTSDYICHQVIKPEKGSAVFTDRCCRRQLDTDKVICDVDLKNQWINILNITLSIVKIGLFLFGPLFLPTQLYSEEFETYRYVIKFKEYLKKTLYITHDASLKGSTPKHVIDLRRMPGFKQCKELTDNLPKNTIVPIKINQFDVSVAYRKLVVENRVPVGLGRTFFRAFCQCKIRDVGPFKDCCTTNLYGRYSSENPIAWIRFWKIVGRVLMVILIPAPFYIRVVFYYVWEHDELKSRTAAAHNVGLQMPYEHKLVFFFSPLHPLLLGIYIIYFATCFVLAFCSAKWWRRHFQQVAVDAFRELRNLSQLNALGMVVNNFIWPLQRFGLMGFIVGIAYWPLIMPVTLVLYAFYCIPVVFLTISMVLQSRGSLLQRKARFEREKLREEADNKASLLETTLVDKMKKNPKPQQKLVRYRLTCLESLLQIIISIMCVVSLYAIMLMFSECIGFLMEVAVFTLMGIIVNAGITLRYVTLVLLVVLYGHDCYSHANLKYSKLNKAIFSDIKGRIKDLEEVTQLPSELQQNQGFKSVELSEQGEHEEPDELSRELDVTRQRQPLCWVVNDLLLFVDKEDTPRIPRRLFEKACNIRVGGAPGPVYRSLIEATGRFMIIIFFLLFVFLVVMSFGEVYRVSSSNQTLATVAGGFLPFMLRYILKPKAPDIELGSVSFKSKLDEVIKNYRQSWPLCDLQFEEDTGDSSDEEGSSESDDEDKKDKKKKSKKSKDGKDKDKKDDKGKKDDDKKSKDDKDKDKQKNIDVDNNNSRKGANKEPGSNNSSVKRRKSAIGATNNSNVIDILLLVPENQTRYSSWLPEWSDVESDAEEEDPLKDEKRFSNIIQRT